MSPKDLNHEARCAHGKEGTPDSAKTTQGKSQLKYNLAGKRSLTIPEREWLDNIIIEWRANRKSVIEIAEYVGLHRNSVYRRAHRLRLAGRMKHEGTLRGAVWLKSKLTAEGKNIGRMDDCLDCMGVDVVKWLYATRPKGLSVPEYVALIVKDFHEIETEGDE